MIPQNVLDAKLAFTDAVQVWSHSQVDIWQQVPYWALMADYQHGFGDSDLALAYETGYWRIKASMGICDYTEIDCATGDLHLGVQASHQHYLNRLDALPILDELRSRANSPHEYYQHPTSVARNEHRYKHLLRTLDLGPDTPYRRPVLVGSGSDANG